MPQSNRRPASDSPQGRKDAGEWLAYCETAEPELPPGHRPLTEYEIYLYRAYLSSRLQWRKADKATLLKLLKIETRIAQLDEAIEEQGFLQEDDTVINTLVKELGNQHSKRLTHLRALDLASMSGHQIDPLTVQKPRATRGAKAKQQKANNLLRMPGQ